VQVGADSATEPTGGAAVSYESENVLRKGTTLGQAREVVTLLGYKRIQDGLKVPRRTDAYFWFEERDYKSYVGIELGLYRDKHRRIKVTTRSRAGRSYWDLAHQKKTLKVLRDFLGGHFETEAGRNRYWEPGGKPPLPIASGCYLARCIFHNALSRAKIYLNLRELKGSDLKGSVAQNKSWGWDFADQMNPRLLSNNMVIPYLVAIWEEFFKSTFTAVLRYSPQREAALKRAKPTADQLEQIATGFQTVETAVAEAFYFQRPSDIGGHFKLLDPRLDIAGALRKPHRRRKVSLYDSIEKVVEDRHRFVHTGQMNLELFDKDISTVISDFEVAANRAYEYIARFHGFTPIRDF
jgi:hypothetical protein